MSDGKSYRCHHGDYNEQAPLVFADTLTGYLQECIDKTGIVSKALLTFSNKDAYARIRQFLNYLAEKGIIEMDLSRIVPHYKRGAVLPTTYTPDEISRVEASVDTNTTIGKRSLAIIRLASRMGLRAGDIAKCIGCSFFVLGVKTVLFFLCAVEHYSIIKLVFCIRLKV